MKKEIAITAYKCKKCGKIHYPYHDRCLACKGRDFEKIKPTGDAKLLTYTQIFNREGFTDIGAINPHQRMEEAYRHFVALPSARVARPVT